MNGFKWFLVMMLGIAIAGELNIYAEQDFASLKVSGTILGTTVQVPGFSQTSVAGIGVEYITNKNKGFGLVIGGRYQTQRDVVYLGTTGGSYSFHIAYGQIIFNLEDTLSIGGELNYCFPDFPKAISGSPIPDGVMGYGFFVKQDLGMLFIKGGYRVVAAEKMDSSSGYDVLVRIESSGFYGVCGFSF